MRLTHHAVRAAMLVGVVAGSSFGVRAYFTQSADPPEVVTAAVTRGHVIDAISATGTLEAVTTVQVGTQVSGTVRELIADFNDIVRKGQVLARLDPSLFRTQVDQARANLVRAEADVERLAVALADAQVKLARARQLSERQLIARTELDTAEVNVQLSAAQLASTRAQAAQARAALNQTQVSLDHTVIVSPIDGIVVSRNVDVGQTVAASMQAPTLYVLAADLTRMRVNASLDESDIGRIREGQAVTFRVGAYPGESFEGRVAQVRLQPVVSQNVVTYTAVIDVPNPGLELKAGMTATVSIEVSRREGVLRVANAALRFKPAGQVTAQRAPGAIEGQATVWQYVESRFVPVTITTGTSDGSVTEIAQGSLDAGDYVVTQVSTGGTTGTRSGVAASPLMMGGPPAGGPPGPPPGPPPF